MRRAVIALILLLCIGSIAAAVVRLQGDWRWFARAPESAVASKDPSTRMSQPPARAGDTQEHAVTERAVESFPASRDHGFDIARINPQGASVFAGRAEPGGNVTVFADGAPIGSAQTDENGEWVLVVERAFASKDPTLSLKFVAGSAGAAGLSPSIAAAPTPNNVDETARAPGKRAAAEVTTELIDNLRQRIERARARKSGAIAGLPGHVLDQGGIDNRPATQTGSLPDTATGGLGGLHEQHNDDASRPTKVAIASQVPRSTLDATAGSMPAGSVPVPIKFVFNEAVLSDDGRRAAQLLVEYVMLEKFTTLKLTGHADERGTHEYNLALSSQRLKTVADMLRAAGYAGELRLVPMGDTAPFMGVDRSKFSRDALYELDRRVELHEPQP